nr:MAG TPA: Baseplate structural protein [Caudoviricetes sp.]
MPAIQQPDFNNIFASAAALGEIINWPAEDYLEGWGYLNNNEPPPMEYFNAYFNGTDNKLLYLFESVNIRKNNTAYQIDDIITSPNLSSKFYLVCTQAGTTDANEPDYTNASINQEITDGTTKWLVVRKSGNMEAATAEADGKGGMVPAPKAGDEDSFLSGSATYVPIATQTEAEAQKNQNNKKPMTPLRVYQAIVAYFTQFLAAAVFTGIVKTVAPAADSNDKSVPTTSWVRTCFESMAKTVAEILEIQWKAEATGYLLLGPYLGNLKILWEG